MADGQMAKVAAHEPASFRFDRIGGRRDGGDDYSRSDDTRGRFDDTPTPTLMLKGLEVHVSNEEVFLHLFYGCLCGADFADHL